MYINLANLLTIVMGFCQIFLLFFYTINCCVVLVCPVNSACLEPLGGFIFPRILQVEDKLAGGEGYSEGSKLNTTKFTFPNRLRSNDGGIKIDKHYFILNFNKRSAFKTTIKVDPSCAITAGPIGAISIRVSGTKIATIPILIKRFW